MSESIAHENSQLMGRCVQPFSDRHVVWHTASGTRRAHPDVCPVSTCLKLAVRRERYAKAAKGFSLIELLIVVAIILIIAAIAIPNLLRSKIAANEASAVGSLCAR